MSLLLEFISRQKQKYSEYAERYDEKIIELQKRTARIFIVLYAVYLGLLYWEKMIVWEEILGVLFVILISAVHYLIFRYAAGKHPKIVRPLSLLYSVVILLTVIGISAFFGAGLSIVAIDVAMVLIAVTIIVPMRYWLILVITIVCAVLEHALYLMYTGGIETIELESLRFYLIEYLFLCIFTVIINISFSNLKQKEIEAEQLLLHKNRTDRLTGLYNREYLEDCVNRARAGVMICIDLDNFKMVNDCLGHKAGDRLLVEISDIFKKHFRRSDCIARIGGDEFLIFLENMTEYESVLERVEKLLSEFPIAMTENGREILVSLSVGVVFADVNFGEMSFKTLYEKSDEAMYKAKNGGKGRAVVLATQTMPEKIMVGKKKH